MPCLSRSAIVPTSKWWKVRLKGKRLNAVTSPPLEEVQRDLLAEWLAAQPVLHYMKFFRHILNKAVRDGNVEKNPFASVKLPKVATGKTRFLTQNRKKPPWSQNSGPSMGLGCVSPF